MPGWFFSAAELAEHRADEESLMTLTLTPYAPNGGSTVVNDQETFDYDTKTRTAGRLRGEAGMDTLTRTVTIGGADVPVVDGGLLIPLDADAPKAGVRGIGWEYVVDGVGATDDPDLLGRRYLVTNAPAGSHATARRLDVAEIPQ